MKNSKKISRENLKSINGGIDNRKKCCARDNCGSFVYWVSNNQLCPSVIIPAC